MIFEVDPLLCPKSGKAQQVHWKSEIFVCLDVLHDYGLLKDYQFTILDNQDFRVENHIPVDIERESSGNCVEIFDICQYVPDRGGIH